MRFHRPVYSILFLLLIGCQTNSPDYNSDFQRAHDPWVFRSVLDAKARMLTIALHDDLWVAYSASNGALYKVWRGGVNFDGAVYTTVHGPQPSSLGDSYFENQFDPAWKILKESQEIEAKIQYRGHRFDKGQVHINYELQLEDGTSIKIKETPEYVVNTTKQVGFQRVFETDGVPSDVKLIMKTNFSSVALERNIRTNSTLSFTKKEVRRVKGLRGLDLTGELELIANGTTTLTAFFTKKPLIENKNKVIGAEDEEVRPLGYRLISRNDCKTCHNTYVQTIGPAYVDVAERYDNTEQNVNTLVTKVKNGGSGNWGEALMNAHPEVDESDIRAMIEYIMTLDAEEEAARASAPTPAAPEDTDFLASEESLDEGKLIPGLINKVYYSDTNLDFLADVNFDAKPDLSFVLPNIHLAGADLSWVTDNFAFDISGYIRIPESNNYVFRLISDDGSRLIIDDKVIVDHDGGHGADPKDGEVALSAGLHPFHIRYFQGRGGKSIRLEWRSFNDGEFTLIPATAFMHAKDSEPSGLGSSPLATELRIPGDALALQEVHPSYDLFQARPDEFSPKVGGMDFLSDGRLVLSTWDAEGGVYIVDGVQSGDPSKMTYKKIANGLAEPLGLKVVDDEIYVLQKQELTKLIDHDGDELIDEYYTLCNSWRVSDNFHEFAFGLVYKEGYFYAALAIAILPGGASANPQIPDRGKAVRISKETGEFEIVAEGLRTPNGIGIGADGEIFIADNQGDWLPSSKILHVRKGDFFGSRAVDSARVAQLPVKQPVVWLPQDEIGNSPTTPLALNHGPYKGQMIHGEVTHGGVKRVFVEKVGGEYQGAVFRFIQGIEAGVNRMVWGPDNELYIGGIGSTGNWRQDGKLWYGLQRLKYNEKSTFEMLAIRAKSDGMEIEFTEALPLGTGGVASDYTIQQWRYLPTHNYGGPKLDLESLNILSVNVSEDRKKVFLELAGLKPLHIVYIHLPYDWISANNHELWSTEAWYTLNQIPENEPGFKTSPDLVVAPNTLTEIEQKAGWKLLFDGKSTDGWRNYGKQTIGSAWKISDNALMLDNSNKVPNSNKIVDGGDLITEEEFENFELRLEWKISACGNSGIMFNVVESEENEFPYLTGPEMQVLDNSCHPDAKIEMHRAGDLYDMIACKFVTVKPSGNWNKVRLVINNGKVEHWLNGRKVVEYQMFDENWKAMIANSKFKEWKSFGVARKGHICLQDHDDRVWYRNIKIKEL